MHKTVLLIASILLIGMACLAEEITYRVALLAQEPALDGKVTGDMAWDRVQSTDAFKVYGTNAKPERKTRFWAAHSKDALFIGVECTEPEPDKLKAVHKDMGALWEEDSIEIFLLPKDAGTYTQFIINAIGSRFNKSNGSEGADIPLGNWQAAVHRDKAFWSLEVKIPWKMLNGFSPARGDTWTANICRNIVGPVDGTENLTWAAVEDGFHDPENFAEFTFAKGVREPDKAGAGDKHLVFARPMGVKGKLGTFVKKGAEMTRISFIQGAHVMPQLAPLGDKVLFHSNQGGTLGVFLTDRKAKKVTRVCDGSLARWSPDARRIVFVRKDRIYERDLDSGKETLVSPDNRFCCYPSYMPDGSILFVQRKVPNEPYAVLKQIKDGAAIDLASGEILSTPAASPDGKTIAIQQGPSLYLLDANAAVVKPLCRMPGIQSWPAWSRDGQWIYFNHRPEPYGGYCDIRAVKVKDPSKVQLIQKDVCPGFGWDGGLMGPIKRSGTGAAEKITGEETLNPENTVQLVFLDRFGDDLILPGAVYEAVMLKNMRGPFLGLLKDGGMRLSWYTTSRDPQDLTAGGQKGQRDYFKHMARCDLPGPTWSKTTLSFDDSKKEWKAAWTEPFPAQWRLTVMEGDKTFSVMWNAEGREALKECVFIKAGSEAYIYLWGPARNTPADKLTPADVLRNYGGLYWYDRRLDVLGLRGYRTCERDVAYPEITTRPPGWSPTLVHVRPGDVGILEALMGIRADNTPEPQAALVKSMSADMQAMIGALDLRIEEWEAWLRDQTLLNNSEMIKDPITVRTGKEAAHLLQVQQRVKVTPLSGMQEATDKLVAMLGKTSGHLYYKNEYKALAKVTRAALEDRQKKIMTFRNFARRLRNQARRVWAEGKGPMHLRSSMLSRTGDMLRKRYYLEGDWRGEMPLRGENACEPFACSSCF